MSPSQRGFSLIELVIMMVLVATLAGLGAAALSAGLPGQQLRGAARELAAELRLTRAQAIATGREQSFRLDVRAKTWQSVGNREGSFPDELDLVVTSAREEQPASGIAAVRFFPDGAATGGRIVIKRGRAAWRVDVAWLTGEVSLHRGEGAP